MDTSSKPTSRRRDRHLRPLGLALAFALLASLFVATTPSAQAASTTTARGLLGKLGVAAESASSTYNRDRFKHWTDADRDCQDTRAEVLITETKAPVKYTATKRCTVSTGQWYSYYDGATWTKASDVDIDHLVALKEAWESGARSWTADQRTKYANDLGFGATLIAVTDNVNSSKGDRDPAQWLPPRTAARCTYATQWVQVKYRWRMTIDTAERDKLSSILAGSCGAKAVTIPARAR